MHNPMNLSPSSLVAQEFDQLHGAKIQIEGMWFYEDGATRGVGHLGTSSFPSDPTVRNKNIIYHHEELVRRAREQAEHLKHNLKQRLEAAKRRPHDFTAVPPTDTDFDKLEQMVALLRECEGKLEQARTNAKAGVTPAQTQRAVNDESKRNDIAAAETRLQALSF